MCGVINPGQVIEVRAIFKSWLQVRFKGLECAWLLWRLSEDIDVGGGGGGGVGVGQMVEKMIFDNKEKLEFIEQQKQGKKNELPKSRPRLGTPSGGKRGDSRGTEHDDSDDSDHEKPPLSSKNKKNISSKNVSSKNISSKSNSFSGKNVKGVTFTSPGKGMGEGNQTDIPLVPLELNRSRNPNLKLSSSRSLPNLHDISIESWETSQVNDLDYVVLLYPLHPSVQARMVVLMSESPYDPVDEDLIGDYNYQNDSDDD